MTSLSQIENQITETRNKLAELENNKKNIKILEALELDESHMLRTSNINVDIEVDEHSSESDEYGYSNDYRITLTYEYTNLIFETATKVSMKPVIVKLKVISNEEQTYECRYEPRKECQVAIIATDKESGKRIFNSQLEDVEDIDGLEYSKTGGEYLHIVDYILTQVDCNDDWADFIKKLS